ncbi:amidohydrolase family protein [Marasmitruncus massiliensis]|uniref:amidohydrolase family protein n=1 Tax=Marasmitruncus massiliensis TaxID=1944642 RepID=UPI000C7B74B4|nr:amidohydrolase [Marasmitruncus massiliensis]
MTDYILTNAVIVTVDPARRVLFDGALAVENGRIAVIGRTEELIRQSPDTRRIDCTGKAVFPGFINTHNHLFQTLLKGLGDDMVLSDWLRTMTFPAARFLTPEDSCHAAMLGCAEAVRSGVTTMTDYLYLHHKEHLTDGVAKAMTELKIRGVIGSGAMDAGLDAGVCPEITQTPEVVEREMTELFDRYHNSEEGRLKVWAAPAALWSNSEKMLRMLWELTSSYHSGITIHVSETPFDRKATEALHGCAGTDCLEKLGILGPNVLMVHCVYLNQKDIAAAKQYDLKVSHNAVSNMYLSSGVAPVPAMLKAGVTVSLGVDGAASNNGQDMLELMKSTALLHKVSTLDPTVITAEKVLEMATIDGARALGMEDEVGSLEVGKKADFVVFNPYLSPKSIPMHNPVSTLVYSSTMANIESVAVDGRFILENGVLTTADERKILEDGYRAAEQLASRAGITNRGAGHPWCSVYAENR